MKAARTNVPSNVHKIPSSRVIRDAYTVYIHIIVYGQFRSLGPRSLGPWVLGPGSLGSMNIVSQNLSWFYTGVQKGLHVKHIHLTVKHIHC